MKRQLLRSAILAGVSSLAIASMSQAQTALYPGFDEAVTRAATSDWATSESQRGGLFLVAQFDSNGPDAWDASAHPLVYITSESNSNPNPNKKLEGGFAGFQLIDAYSKEVFASFLGVTTPDVKQLRRGPHGVDVSPDGKWAYVGWSENDDSVTGYTSYVAVVNMQTLKIDKLLKQQSYFRGQQRAQRLHHVQSWRDIDGNDRVVLQWGFGANGGPQIILDPNDDSKVVRSITYDDVQVQGHPFTTPSPDGKTLYVSIGSPELREEPYAGAGIAKVDLETGDVTNIMGVCNHPIGITHDVDGNFTYVVDGTNSMVYKIDDATDEIVGKTSAGVAGPYGIAFNWDESLLFTVGKGEGTHNRGSVLGVIDAERFTRWRGLHQMPIFLGGSASSVEHAILHPDPEVNEMWISNMNGWETIVLDLETYTATDWIPTPNGGDTHSGGFVRYNPDFTGELLTGMGVIKA
ncbi:MAG: YncE family protein, partial [Paracoccaceae bacterium]